MSGNLAFKGIKYLSFGQAFLQIRGEGGGWKAVAELALLFDKKIVLRECVGKRDSFSAKC